MKWEPSTYTEFADYRGRPYLDLMARVEHLAPKKIVDLGCGPGNMTRLLAERWPEALVLGLDSSRQMIDTAHAGDNPPNLRFELADATSWQADDTIDLLFSNAMLQWIPGHLQLLRGWLRQLESEAAIAIQVPGNFDSPSHAVMRQVAERPDWSAKLAGVLRHADAVAAPADYQRLLIEEGFTADVWETSYRQLLTGSDPILDWVRGTALLPVKAALAPEDYRRFEDDYRQAVGGHYRRIEVAGGQQLTNFPFRRIFMVGQKLGRPGS